MSTQLGHVLSAYLMNGMHCEIFPVRKSADVSRHDFGRCCTDSTGDGETNLNSTQLFSCKVNQSSLYTG